MNFSLSNLMSDYYLSSLYRQNSGINSLSGLYGQNNNAFYLGGLYGRNNVLGDVQSTSAGTTVYPSFQSVFAASLKGQSSQELSVTDSNVQVRLNAANGECVVNLPPELEKKLESDPEFAQSIMNKISAFMMLQDTVTGTLNSFSIALDEDGNLSDYRFSGDGGQAALASGKTPQNNKGEKPEWMLQQVRQHHL